VGTATSRRVNRLPLFGFVLALLIVIFGTAVIYWPAAVILTGLGLGTVSLLVNDDRPPGGRE